VLMTRRLAGKWWAYVFLYQTSGRV
jgi:hypothetical protein